MSNDICGVDLDYGEGICEFPGKHPDGKCGIHSDHNDSRSTGRSIEEPLLQEFLDREKKRKTAGTYDTRITGLRAFDEWIDREGKDVLELGGLSIEDFAAWLTSDTGRGVADGTATKYVEQVSKFYQYLQKREKEECGTEDIDNPVDGAREGDLSTIITDPHTPERAKAMKDDGYRGMSPEEFEAFSENLPAPKARNQLIFQLMWDCGLRPVEVTDIELDDLDRGNREIHVRSEKTHLNRTVFYGEKVATMLRIWLDGGERTRYNYAETSPYLLVSEQAEQITVTLIETHFREAAKEAGLHDEVLYVDAKGNPHYELDTYSLRHGFAERMVDKPEMDLETLRVVMGHKNLETTKQYVNPDKETRRRKIQSALD
jgi:site-specific recombinase XerD